jgi:hypothetical protein
VTLRDKLVALLGTWSRPPDFPGTAALVLALVFAAIALAGRGRSFLFGVPLGPRPSEEDELDAQTDRRRFLAAAALAAALLSIAYVSSYLRGGPRIVDATTYFLQGRALAHGDLSWTPLEPSASFRGRFLVYTGEGHEPTLGGIFPPGYPLLLAFGFFLGSPMIVGPLLAGALVLATYRLARTLAEESHPALAEPIARSAALASVFCGALRYHTADTMSHGATALGVTIALLCALRARREVAIGEPSPFDHGRGEALFAGLAVGYVVATRPASAIPIAIVVVCLLWRRSLPAAPALVPLALVGLVPGILLLLLSQRMVTGSWLASTQRLYYTLSDGPPGCFRWGFGRGTGCIVEHGEYVHARLEHGYGVLEAAGTTLRRLRMHLLDVANLELLAPLVLLPAFSRSLGSTARRPIRSATALLGLQVLAYAPFYFDGDYPGGGARFFADILPVEHALLVIGAACLVARARDEAGRAFVRAAFTGLALATAGFAIHASYEHGKLRDRDGGRPMFEPDVLAHASLKSGLVFVDTDHGFALGHDPAAHADREVVVARRRSDARDRMLFEALGRPPSYLYRLDPAQDGGPSLPVLTPWAPPENGPTLRFEAEAEWPALYQEGGFAAPGWVGPCASNTRALVLTPTPAHGGRRHARATITVPVPSAGLWSVDVRIVGGASVPFAPTSAEPIEGALTLGGARWTWKPPAGCETLESKQVELAPPHAVIELSTNGGPIALDYVSLRKVR